MTVHEETPAVADLAALRDTALVLLSQAPVPPSSIRVRSGDVEVEIAWSGAVSGTAVPQTAVPQTALAQAPVAHGTVPDAAVPRTPAAESVRDGAAQEGVRHITAGLVGTFYRSPSPGTPCFVEPGDQVTPGQQVAIVEAMKLMTPVEADCAGTVLEVFAPDGAPVEFGTPLLAIACD